VLGRIPPRLTVSIERETFPRMLDRPGRLYAMRSSAYWLDIGTPQKYLEAQLDVASGKLGTPPTPGTTEDRPGVWIEPGVEIDPDAIVIGPSVIGAGASIAAGARVEASMVGRSATVGAGASVLRSVLLPGVAIGPGVATTDEVVGREVTLPCA
jgi:NDP-sugar pyrophosphorylase family protein